MPTNEFTYYYVSSCEICGETKLTEEPNDFTITVEVKEEYGGGPLDHDCEFTEHEELEEPVTREVTYGE